MFKHHVLIAIAFFSAGLSAQNDQDALRYSMTGFGGTSRSKAMGGSFGALGADGSCMGINPAGIGLFRKGDINLSVGLRFNTVNADYANNKSSDFKASAIFDGFSLVGAWDSKTDRNSHHALGISINQIANYNSNTTISGYSRNTRMNDVLAQAGHSNPADLDNSYSGMFFSGYVLDTITSAGIGKHYYSFVDPTKSVKQTNQIATTGRTNELNFNYAYAYMDKLYVGIAIGVPMVNFDYTSTYKEEDDRDSMRISGGSSTYPYDVYNYQGYGGFKSFTYTETYKTTGTGINGKIGVIYRLTDYLRIGASYQSPTMLKLTDAYVYQLQTVFDGGGNQSMQYPPQDGGRFNYRIITPQRFTGSIAYIYQKRASINVDYEHVNYGQASVRNASGSNFQADFTGVNNAIKNNYTGATNLRVGAELNLQPWFIRLGYAMYGSPYGDVFSGSLVRNYITGGIGYRKDKFYLDLSLVKSISKSDYYMFNSKYVDKTTLSNSGTTIAATIGCKF